MKEAGFIFSWRRLAVAFLFLPAPFVCAQDVHFSQPYSTPIFINPAMTGFSNSDMRINLNHREQWRSVTVPFQTLAVSLDAPFLKRKFQRDVFAIGLMLVGDRAGDSEFGTTQAELALSYIKALGGSNRTFIGFGARGGYTQWTINYEKLNFDQQYNGFFFDPTLPTGEYSLSSSLSYYDFTAGMHFSHQFSHFEILSVGYSLSHLSRPDISLIGDQSVRLPMRHALYSTYEREVRPAIYIQPSAYFFLQNNFREVLLGITIKQERISNPDSYYALYYGVHSRAVDAAVLFFGSDKRNMNMGFSYDINYSLLRQASKAMGGFEISLNWKLQRKKSSRIKMVPCPMF